METASFHWEAFVSNAVQSFEEFKAENFGLFICRCSRGDIASITSAPHGADGLVYPGTCRNGTHSFSTEMRKNPDLLQSNIRMHPMLDKTFFNFQENIFRKSKPAFTFSEFKKSIGDVVLWRRGYAAYHLASVIDDAHQGVTDVIRGEDLFEATKIHVVIPLRYSSDVPWCTQSHWSSSSRVPETQSYCN